MQFSSGKVTLWITQKVKQVSFAINDTRESRARTRHWRI